MKHTPGPWRLEQCRAGQFAVYANTELKPYWICEYVKKEHDARLIAAAPDLLDALQKISKELKTSNDRMKMIETIETLTNAAIAKAEGKS